MRVVLLFRWCAENFHKKLLPFLAEQCAAKSAMRCDACFHNVAPREIYLNFLWWQFLKPIWVWVNTYRYIFSGMNIHLPGPVQIQTSELRDTSWL